MPKVTRSKAASAASKTLRSNSTGTKSKSAAGKDRIITTLSSWNRMAGNYIKPGS